MEVTMQLGRFFGMVGFTMGPLLGLLLLLNSRDRRQGRLLDLMLDLTPRELCDRIVFEVRCSLLSRRSLVAVDMCSCSREEIWKAIGRWSANLPAMVRLQVNGRVDRDVPAVFTVETGGRRTLCCPPAPSAVAG